MTVKVKICGITTAAAFDTAVTAGADWVGFVFFPPSPRYVTPIQAAELSARCSGGPKRVGLFVSPTSEAIARTHEAVRMDVLQLYGVLDLAALRARFGLPVWHALGVSSATDLPTTASGADRLVVEAKPPRDATRPGGNAAQFDWSLLAGWRAPAPWILAGGLTPDNVARAIRITGASAVDVSSGVESAPGVKDPALIRTFITNARWAGIRLRRAAQADAEALGRVHVQAWREAYSGLLPDGVLESLDPQQQATMWRDRLASGSIVHVAERDGAIVGFGAGGLQLHSSLPYSAEVHALYVMQSAQRCGVGRALMAAMARDLLRQGHWSAVLWVLESNTPARRFYEALGGRVVERREQLREGVSAIGVAYGWEDLAILA
jgi:phosphoribosylanthranilate isomerase